MIKHLKELQISFFQAPEHKKIKPYHVLKNMEYLELITGGHTLFSGPDGKNTRYERGTLFWHRGGENTIYRYHGDDPYSCYVFRFIIEGKTEKKPRITIPAQTESLLAFASDMFRLYHSGEQENPYFCEMVYHTFLWYALGPQRQPGQHYPDSLKTAIAFMETNLDSPLHLSEIADVAGISQPYLFSVFKRYLQKSPHSYLLELRISRAKQLLASGDLPIKEIAEICGFESLEVFYRQFGTLTGTTPAAYRKTFHLREL
jgi:AraC-like DNA-binding protein